MKTTRRGLFKIFGVGAAVAALPCAPSKADVVGYAKKKYSPEDFMLRFPRDPDVDYVDREGKRVDAIIFYEGKQ